MSTATVQSAEDRYRELDSATREMIDYEEFYESLTIYERLLSVLGQQNKDEAAVLANQVAIKEGVRQNREMLQGVMESLVDGESGESIASILDEFVEQEHTQDETQIRLLEELAEGIPEGFERSNLPPGLEGVASEAIDEGEEGRAFFRAAGRAFTAQVEAKERIDNLSKVVIDERMNQVVAVDSEIQAIGANVATEPVDTAYSEETGLANGSSIEVEVVSESGNLVDIMIDDTNGNRASDYDLKIEKWSRDAERYMPHREESGETAYNWSVSSPSNKTRVTVTNASGSGDDYALNVEAKRR